MTRDFQVTVDCADPRALSRFWAAVLDYTIPPPPGRELSEDEDVFDVWQAYLSDAGLPEDQWNAASAAEDPTGVRPRIFFQRVPEGKTAKNRLHLDVRAAPGLEGDERMEALEAECARLVALGATRDRRSDPDPPLNAGFIVMADPEGNEFCLD